MENLSWNNPSNRAMAIPSSICSHQLPEPGFVYRAVGGKSELMNESLHGITWQLTGEDFLRHQEEVFAADSSGNTVSSHHLLPLPLTTSSSSDVEILRNFRTSNSGCENSVSGVSQNYSDSFCNQRMETERHHFSTPMRNFRDSANPLKKTKVNCSEPTSISFGGDNRGEIDGEAIAHVKEIIYIAAALRPVILGVEEAVEKPRRKNLRISNDPQTAAARHRRERISNRLRVLQRLVPGGRKMDTASMLDEAANYLKFLKAQVSAFENLGHGDSSHGHIKSGAVNYGHGMLPFPVTFSS